MNEPRLLSVADIPAAMRLKEAAGWNQTEQDWRNLLRLEPGGCFGIDCDGEIRATTTAVCYGEDLAWIGMVLTDPAYRGRGLARRLMRHAIEYLERRRVRWIKLDATDMGRPLYLQLGFEDECAIERWVRPAGPLRCDVPNVSREIDLQLDRAAFGADRSTLLRVLCETGWAASLPSGFAMGRAGSNAVFFGPCVSRSEETARKLAELWLSQCGAESAFWDLLPSNRSAERQARELGFAPLRRLTRMARRGVPGASKFFVSDCEMYATAGFEYG